MKLNKALKLKNTLAGQLKHQQNILARENSRRLDSSSNVDREAVYNKITALRLELIDLKTKITKANVGIYAKLAEMEELKGFITYIQMLETKHGVFEEIVGMGQREPKKVDYSAYLTQEKVDGLVIETQKQIDVLQDKIDEYNAATDI